MPAGMNSAIGYRPFSAFHANEENSSGECDTENSAGSLTNPPLTMRW